MNIKKTILAMLFLILISTPIFSANESDVSELKEEISTKSNQLLEKQKQMDVLTKKQNDMKEQQKQIKIDKKDLNDKIDDSKVNITNYLLFVQKAINEKFLLNVVTNKDFINNIYFSNKIFQEMSKEFKELASEIDELEIMEKNIKDINKSIITQKENLDKDIKSLNSTYRDLNEKLLKLEEEIEAKKQFNPSADISNEKEQMMRKAGISKVDFQAVNFIVSHESSWNYTATNPYSGAYGLCQALPGIKMASQGSDWKTNPITQLQWCDGYATAAYGSWDNAEAFWIKNNWW